MPTSNHHSAPGSSLRFRLYLGGELADETWVEAADPASGDLAQATAELHAKAVNAAAAEGFGYVLEVFDPDAPPGSQYLKFGTDTTGMCNPLPVAIVDLGDLA